MASNSAFDLLPIGVLEFDSEQRVVAVDPQFCKVFGCSCEAVLGRGLDELLDPQDRRGADALHRKLSKHGGKLVDTHAELRLAGVTFYARLRMKRTEAGWVAFVENSLVDDDLSYQMLVAQRRWESVVRTTDAGIVILDREARILDFNSQFFNIMRFRSAHGVAMSEAAITSRKLGELIADKPWSGLLRAVADVAQGSGKVLSTQQVFHEQLLHGDRSLDVKMKPIVLPIKGVIGSCTVITDVTEQRQLEAARMQQAQASGMAEIATNVLHNLGNLCGSVIFGAEELTRLARSSSFEKLLKANALLLEHRGSLAAYFTEGKKGQALVDYFLNVGELLQRERRETAQRVSDLASQVQLMQEAIAAQQSYARGTRLIEELDLGEVLDHALDIHRAGLLRHGVEVERRFAPVRRIRAQKTKLTHVIINLIKNAKEAMHNTNPGHRRLRVEVGDRGGAVEALFFDTGEGIPHDKLDSIFAHGMSTKEFGHGFGLHFCATAMREMGGSISVHSDGVEKGACFCLRFEAAAMSIHP